jgi:hypothetical protein
MKRTVVAALGAALIATLAASSDAEASSIDFDFSAFDGSITHDGSSLSTSTFLNLDDSTLLVMSLGAGDDSGLHEFDPVTLTGDEISYGLTPGPLGADVVLSWPLSPEPGADTFTETLTTVESIARMPSIDPDFIAVTLSGSLTDADGLFTDAPVVLKFTATQAGDNIPSVSFSNTSIVTPSIPEPSTWVMMALGFGALGYAGFRRRRANGAALFP